MYYVKIPLRHLGKPDRLKVDDEVKQQLWEQRVTDVLADPGSRCGSKLGRGPQRHANAES